MSLQKMGSNMDSNMDRELESLIESILKTAGGFLVSFFRAVWRGARKLNTLKKLCLYLLFFPVSAGAWAARGYLDRLLWQAPVYIRQGVLYILVGFPVLVLYFLGMGDSCDDYGEAFREIAFHGKDNQYPVFCGKNKNGQKVILTFKSNIPLAEWRNARDRLETALDCNILKMENGSNKRIVRLTTLPSGYVIPSMIEWSEDYLDSRKGVLTVGKSALENISFDLNRVPHVLVAGETGSGKSVILRCLLWQMILQGAQVYMIDFKGGVEFGKQYEKYGEVIMERDRALKVLEMLVKENDSRLRKFRDLEVKNLDEYNSRTKQNLCRIGVFTDELAEMLDKKGVAKEEKIIYEQLEGKLSTLARLSRATGINLFMGVQRPDANVLTGQIKNNIPVRISGRFADKTASEIVLGNTDAVNLPDIKGRFLYKVGNETIEFQSFYFDDERMLREVDVEQGDMLTVPCGQSGNGKNQIRNTRPEEQDEHGSTGSPPPGCPESKKNSGGKSKKYMAGRTVTKGRTSMKGAPESTPGRLEAMSSRELEAEIRKMDEEDLNLNFGDF